MYSFPDLEPFCCSMSSSNCCFLTCIQISQEAGQVVWYSHLFKNFPQFVVIHIVKGFGVVNKAEVDVLLGLSCFTMIQQPSTMARDDPWPIMVGGGGCRAGGTVCSGVRMDLVRELAIIFITSITVWPQLEQQGGHIAPLIRTRPSFTLSQSPIRKLP